METYEKKRARRKSRADHDADPRVDAARERLQRCEDQKDALEAIREIVANLFGSEEMVLFTVDRTRAVLWHFWSFGIDARQHGMVDALSEPALHAVLEGQIEVLKDERAGTFGNVSAFVPVYFGDDIVAVLAVMKLLPQKQVIEAADLELFHVISTEAGRALFATKPAVKTWS